MRTPAYASVVLIALAAIGCSEKKSSAPASPAPATETTTTAASAGALAILTGEIAPADGADSSTVVGATIAAEGHPEISAVTDEAGKFTIENVLPGTVALYVSSNDGAALTDAGSIGPSAFGLKLPDIILKSGETNDLGLQTLKKTGGFSGKVVFFTNPNDLDLTGSELFVPGTGFIVKTDDQGAFSLNGLPPGKYSLRAQHQGFAVFDLKDVEVLEGQTTDLGSISLSISNGPEGSIAVTADKTPSIDGTPTKIVTDRTVSATLTYDGDAALMKVADEPSFTNVEWQTVQKTVTWTFTSDGAKSLYVMYSDLNGLESSPYKDEFFVDTEAPSISSFQILNDWVSVASPGKAFVDTVVADSGSGIAEIRFREADGSFNASNPFLAFSSHMNYDFIDTTDGTKLVYAQVRDYAGNVSNIVNDDIAIADYTSITDTTYTEPMTLQLRQSPFLVEGATTIFAAPVTFEADVELNVVDNLGVSFKDKILTQGTSAAHRATIRAKDGSATCNATVEFDNGLPGKSSKTDARFLRFYNIGSVEFNGGRFKEPSFESDCGKGNAYKNGSDLLILDTPHYTAWGTALILNGGVAATSVLGGGGSVMRLLIQNGPATKTTITGGTYTVDLNSQDLLADVRSGDATLKNLTFTGADTSVNLVKNSGDGTVTVDNVSIDGCGTAYMAEGGSGRVLVDGGTVTCGYLAFSTSSGTTPTVLVENVTANVDAGIYYPSGTATAGEVKFDHNRITVAQALAWLENSESTQTFVNNKIDCINASAPCDLLRVTQMNTSGNPDHSFTLTGNNINCEQRSNPPNPVGQGCRGFFFKRDSPSGTTGLDMTLSLNGNHWYGRAPISPFTTGGSNVLTDPNIVQDDGVTGDFSTDVRVYQSSFLATTPVNGLPTTVTTVGSPLTGAPQ